MPPLPAHGLHLSCPSPYPLSAPYLRALSPRLISPPRQLNLRKPGLLPVIESLHALLALIMWPLEPPDDVTLLIHGAKRMAQSADGGDSVSQQTGCTASRPATSLQPSTSPEELDLIRRCFTLGAGTIASPPPTTLLSTSLSTPSSIVLSHRPIADTPYAPMQLTPRHRRRHGRTHPSAQRCHRQRHRLRRTHLERTSSS
ncbi:hypothetical protein M422DRAFT_27488 [Sphaerobolus stellatus SS14]|nr:hypothetical protein M422DRAFT_27488 [Sphaerobolus stellatus SS14]